LVLFAVEARAVSLTLETTNITTFAGQTFQMPLTASDPDGQPLKFSATVSNKKAITATIAPRSNRSLLLNVSGVDGNNQPFTGNLQLQLFEDLVPHTTSRIIDLVNSNFYNGLLFWRVAKGFVAQGGGSTNDDNFGSGITFQDQYSTELTYVGFGQLGMANEGASAPDSDDSQFFITDIDLSLSDPTNQPPVSLNFQNGIFGQLTSGFNIFSKIMSTPVTFNPDLNEVSAPLSNVVINTATIITNSQDGVLRLTASFGFTGQVNVAVSATDAEKQSITQTLQVNVIINSNNLTPFIGLVPTSIVLTQNTAVSFVTTFADVEHDPIFLGAVYAGSRDSLTNITATLDPKTGQIWLDPDVTVTGVVDVLLGVRDEFQPPSSFNVTQCSLTILPRSPSPTMSITSLKGMIKDGSKPGGDSINVSGKFTFLGGADGTFGSNDMVSLALGDPTNPFIVAVGPDSTGYKFHGGSINAKGTVVSGLNNNVMVSAQFNSRSGTFMISVKNFDFPTAISNQVQIGIAVGDDYVTDVRTWVQEMPGIFIPPPSP
jgi:large repetitive protein